MTDHHENGVNGSRTSDEPEEDLQVISLVDESGGEVDFYVHDILELDGHEYYILESVSDAEEVLVLRRDDEQLVSLEDQEELDRVVDLLESDWGEESSEEDG
ncbi:MAG: DUF1292 domain-containing protein [Candidatus Dormibacteria bacterium]